MIQMDHVSRTFGRIEALHDVSCTIGAGEIVCLLGANGAGKTTALSILLGILRPSSGTVLIDGMDLRTQPTVLKRRLGFVPDGSPLPEWMSGREYLRFAAQLYGLDPDAAEGRAVPVLEYLRAAAQLDDAVFGYSHGMRQKLALVSALAHEPAHLLLDEPLNGLDPRSARDLKDLLIEKARTGTAVLLSTHVLALAQEISTRILVLHQGRLLASGTAAELQQRTGAADLEAAFLALTDGADDSSAPPKPERAHPLS